MELALIADDLAAHVWYDELVLGLIAELESYLARWAAFEDAVATTG